MIKKINKWFILFFLLSMIFISFLSSCSQASKVDVIEKITNFFTKTTIAEPQFSHRSGTYKADFNVFIQNMSTENNVVIKYTYDGTNPSKTNGITYLIGETIPITRYRLIKAIAFKDVTDDKFAPSSVVVAEYKMKVSEPLFKYDTSKYELEMSSNTDGAVIYYTDDGKTPSTSSNVYGGGFKIYTTKSIKAIAYKEGWEISDFSTQIFDSVLKTPTISPSSGTFNKPQSIEIYSTSIGAKIYYKIVNNVESPKTEEYKGPFSISKNCTVYAWAEYNGEKSGESLASFTMKASTPIITPPDQSMVFTSLGGSVSIEMACDTPSAVIYYTTDGSSPTRASKQYIGKFNLDSTKDVTVKALAYQPNYEYSDIKTVLYKSFIVTGGQTTTKLTAPVVNDTNGLVQISSTNPTGTIIFYSLDGGRTWLEYQMPFTVIKTTTISAYATKADSKDSDITTYTVTIAAQEKIEAPTFSKPTGTYDSSVDVEVASLVGGAAIYYTTNGSDPTESSSMYLTPIKFNKTTTLKVRAYKDGFNPSDVATAIYTITNGGAITSINTPVLSKTTGTYDNNLSVTISCSTTEATIKYQIDSNAAVTYTTPVTIDKTSTLKAWAEYNGTTLIKSQETSATYTMQVAKPIINPPSGNLFDSTGGSVTVAISCDTANAIIYYTTNGAEPTTASTKYTGTFSVTSTGSPVAIKAIGVLTGFTNSETGYSLYEAATALKLDKPTITINGSTITITSNAFQSTILYSLDGGITWASYASSFTISQTTTIMAKVQKTGYLDSDIATTTAEIVLTPVSSPVISPSGGTYTPPLSVTISCPTDGATIRYTTDGSTPTESSPVYSGQLLILKTATITARGFKDGNSASGSVAALFTLQAEMPSISPVSEIFVNEVTVAISCSTNGVSVYYTLDGSTPTTSSTKYSNSFKVTSTTTIKAIAVGDGIASSGISSITYTKAVPVENPTFSPVAGNFTSAQKVTIKTNTTGAKISYTTNGSMPSRTSGIIANSPVDVSVDSTLELKAIAFKDGNVDSGVTSGLYTILETVADPQFNIASGTYTVEQQVSISCLTTGAEVYYTLDGTTSPTAISTKYTSPIIVSKTTTIKARAYKNGVASSVVNLVLTIQVEQGTGLSFITAKRLLAGEDGNTVSLAAGNNWFGFEIDNIADAGQYKIDTNAYNPIVYKGDLNTIQTLGQDNTLNCDANTKYYLKIVTTVAVPSDVFKIYKVVVTQPIISVDKTTINFGELDANVTGQQIFAISNTGSGTFDCGLTVTKDQSPDINWLNIDTTSLTAVTSTQKSVTVTVNTTNMTPGSYTGKVTITSSTPNVQGTPKEITVSFVVKQAPKPTGLTVHYKRPSTWTKTPKIHYWNVVPTKPQTTWPGLAMTDEGDGWYLYTIEGGTSASIIFNNDSSPQTGNLTRDKEGWYKDGVWTDVNPDPPQPPTITVTPNAGNVYAATENVKISVSRSPTVIKYTVNGTDPATLGATINNDSTVTLNFANVGDVVTLKVLATNTAGTTTKDFVYTRKAEPLPSAFDWNNATVYFVMTDRFYNGNTGNDNSYGRVKVDATGKNIGTFHGGDLAGLTQKLNANYFTDLGVNVLWITAPYEQIHGWCGGGSSGDFAHYAYHGYYVLDYTEVDANMGTKTELGTFIDTAHSKGVRVIFDIVLNHAGYNTLKDMTEFGFGKLNSITDTWTPASGETWHSHHSKIDYTDVTGWAKWWGASWVRSGVGGYTAGGGDDLTKCLDNLPDFITGSTTGVGLPEILKTKKAQGKSSVVEIANAAPKDYLVTWLSDWVKTYGVDGFRCDTAKHVELSVWNQLKQTSVSALNTWRQNNPTKAGADWTEDFWMTGEVWGHGADRSNYYDNGFDSIINFSYQSTVNNGMTSYSGMDGTYSGYAGMTYNPLSYISSHDTSLFYKGNDTDQKKVGTLMLLNPKSVQIFYGDEYGRSFGDTGSDPFQGTRSDFNFTEASGTKNSTLVHWQKVAKFRNNHNAVGAGTHTKIADTPYTFSRVRNTDKVVCVLGATSATEVTVSSVFADGTVLRDAYTGTEATVVNGKVTFTPDANGVILIEKK